MPGKPRMSAVGIYTITFTWVLNAHIKFFTLPADTARLW